MDYKYRCNGYNVLIFVDVIYKCVVVCGVFYFILSIVIVDC